MAFSKKLGIMRGYYISAHRRRMDFYSWKWRLLVILLAALLVLTINDYLQAKYELNVVYAVNPTTGALQTVDYTLAGKLFNWFMTGVLFGIIALAVLNEGEFIIGLYNMTKRFEKQAEREVRTQVRNLGGFAGAGTAMRERQKRKTVKSRRK